MLFLPKKIFIPFLFFLLLLSVVAAILFSQRSSEAQSVSTQLSPRAKEFLASQRSTGTSQWNTSTVDVPVSETQAPDPAGKTLSTRCFTLQSPFQLQKIQQKDTGSACTLEAKVSSPITRIVLQRYRSTSLEDDSAYILRTRMTKDYLPLPLPKQDTFQQVFAFQGEDSVILFVFDGKSIFTAAVAPLANPKSISVEQLFTIVKTLQLPPVTLVANPSTVPTIKASPK
jgi:hypothetical protein